jgi:hydrogenase maturation protein HypF
MTRRPRAETSGRKIRVRGLVQGVGFRPFVWRLAHEAGLVGHVLNDGEGVEIAAWGAAAALDSFLYKIDGEAPPLARVDSVNWEDLPGTAPSSGFDIVESARTEIATGIVPDAATCSDCRAEIFDPANRRFGYAFTNCTHCGPRLSIIEGIPYDRAQTSMRVFAMCPECGREYSDPSDRRFHAQPNACPVCGPQLWLEDANGNRVAGDPILEAARRLKDGEIGAIKGIGGFHLACDATSERAVAELRRRKHRPSKPLALMARDVAEVRRYARVSAEEEALLQSTVAPIVLLEMAGVPLARGVAPDQRRVGVMLAYTPLHHLLMAALDRPIVLTSGNLSEEPQATDNADARARLGGIADFFVMHDRDIINRLDDSVMRQDGPGMQILRRGRGLAPAPLRLAKGFADRPKVLAMGGGLKSAFCFLRDGEAILSQHMGDLENAATYADYRKALGLYRGLYRFDPDVIAVDQHPDYLSTRWGETIAAETGAKIVRVQHHHAHLASCLADNGIEPGVDAIGIVLDGLGLGTDKTIWGGEILVGGYEKCIRAGHFLAVAQPGGDRAQREPWRNLVAHLHAAFGPDWRSAITSTDLAASLSGKPLDLVASMIERGVNAPLSTSAGRLFDAVAAALGIRFDEQDFEGQAAMALEALATPFAATAGAYPSAVEVHGDTRRLVWAPLWTALLGDIEKGIDTGTIAARFHNGLAAGLVELTRIIAGDTGLSRIALSGGVMQNRLLLETLHAGLAARGFEVLVQRTAPANDGGLALGQAAIAAFG